MTATLLKRDAIRIGPVGWSQRDYYRVDPPIEGSGIVAVSRACVFGALETYIFGATEALDGFESLELDGSRKGDIKPADLRMLRLRRGDQVKVTLAKGTANVSRVAILGHQDLKPAAKQPKPKAPAAATAPAAELPQ